MSKRKYFLKPRSKGDGIPSSVMPFPYLSSLSNKPEPPTNDDSCTAISAAEWHRSHVPEHASLIENYAQRKALLLNLIAKFQKNVHVADCDVRLAITTDEWAQLEEQLYHQQPKVHVRKREIDSHFKQYTELLQHADRLHNLGKGNHGVNDKYSGFVGLNPKRPLRYQAEAAYERAIEVLGEIIGLHPALSIYLDRFVAFGQIDGTATLEPEGVPRLVTSRSRYALHNGKPKESKRELRFSAVLESLRVLQTSPPQHPTKRPAVVLAPPDDDDDYGLGDSDILATADYSDLDFDD